MGERRRSLTYKDYFKCALSKYIHLVVRVLEKGFYGVIGEGTETEEGGFIW